MVTLLTRNLWKKLRGMSAFTTVIVRISRTKAKRLTVGEQLGNSRFRTKRRNKFACSKISSSLSSMLFALIFPREHNARVHLTFPLNEMYGYSRLCDRLRSSAIIWKQLSLRSSAIVCDLRSAIRDRLRSYGNQPLPHPHSGFSNTMVTSDAVEYTRGESFLLIL